LKDYSTSWIELLNASALPAESPLEVKVISIPYPTVNGTKNSRASFLTEHESHDDLDSGSESEEKGGIDEAALHTIWDVETAKDIFRTMSKDPALGVFAAIRLKWGKGLEIQDAVDAHIEGMYDSGYAEPTWGDGIFGMLSETRQLAEKLLQVAEFDAAFFFAHAAAAMIRRCEGLDAKDQEKQVVEWAKALDVLMAAAVRGWRVQSGNGKAQKNDAMTLVKLLETGERATGYDQEKWYPETLKALRAWAAGDMSSCIVRRPI
jgi:hypothetical protein